MKKFLVLIVTPDGKSRTIMEKAIQDHISVPTQIYYAADGREAEVKLNNDPPHMLISDFDLAGLKISQVVDSILANKSLATLAIVLLGHPPAEELYIDELITGKVQFLDSIDDVQHVNHTVTKALNFCFQREKSQFRIRFLNMNDVLIREGTSPDFVYLVKKGRLRAYKTAHGKTVPLGEVESGEFVGEMAYFGGVARSASVEAITDCEIIEIPIGTLDRILYRRPSWSKTLMMTLSKRLSQANAKIAELEKDSESKD
jgi:CRP/FNR family cyclic AMP-dependent transcriptional regulator